MRKKTAAPPLPETHRTAKVDVGLIVDANLREQSARTKSALDNRSHRTLPGLAAACSYAGAIDSKETQTSHALNPTTPGAASYNLPLGGPLMPLWFERAAQPPRLKN
jgi:hypothetical protein